MAELPLSGVRVLDMTVVWAGPYSTMLLADWGAEVIRIESTQYPPPTTRVPAHPSEAQVKVGKENKLWNMAYPNWDPGPRAWNTQPTFNAHSRNKLSMTADIRNPEGWDIFCEMLKISDVFSENNVPETMEKWGITYENLSKINPNLVYIRMPAYGWSGSFKDYRALGLHVDAVVGHLWTRSYTDTDMSERGDIVLADAMAGITASFLIVNGLRYRRKTGKGQLIELSLAEGFIPFMSDAVMDYTMNGRIQESNGNRHTSMAPHGCYPCAGDDMWINIAVATDEQWQSFCALMGRSDLVTDERFVDTLSRWHNQDDLDAIVIDWTKDQDHWELAKSLQAQGITAGPVLNSRELLHAPQLRDRDYYHSLTHAESGTYDYNGPLWKMSKTPNKLRLPPCRLGEHNEYVYKELLGISDERYKELEEAGHIGMDFIDSIP